MRRKRNEFFEGIRSSLEEGLDSLRKGKALPTRKVVIPDPPKKMTSRDITALRHQFGLTQTAFAKYLNVSVQAVRAWEQGRNMITGAALRLLHVMRSHPEVVEKLGQTDKDRERHGELVGHVK